MSKKANPGLIGLFVIGAVGMMVGVVLLFGSGSLFRQTDRVVTYFDGSVTGLKKGSSVMFRGVPVGSVNEVFTTVDSETLELDVTIILEIDPTGVRDPSGLARQEPIREIVETLVERGLRSKLIIESLVTGQLAVELDFYPDSPIVLRAPPDSEYLEIPSVPSDLQKAAQTLEGMVGRLDNLEVEKLLATLTNTLASIDRVVSSQQVADILAGADRLINSEDTQQLTADLRASVGKLDATINEGQQLLLDSQQLIAKIETQIDPLTGKLEATLDQVNTTLVATQKSVEGVQALTSEDSELIYRAKASLEETEKAMRSLRELLDFLERNPEALLRGKKQP